MFCSQRKLDILWGYFCLSKTIKSLLTLDNAWLSVVFFGQEYTYLWHYYCIYTSLLPNVRHMPRGMSSNLWPSIRWGEKHGSTLSLLIKTRQCCQRSAPNNVFSALPVEITAQRIAGQTTVAWNHEQLTFVFGRLKPQIDFAITWVCCGITAVCIFYSWRFFACCSISGVAAHAVPSMLCPDQYI